MLAAGALLAGLLILIAILVAGTEASGTHHARAVTARPLASPSRANAAPAASLRAAQSRIGALQASLRAQASQLASATASVRTQTAQLSRAAATLRAARTNARCWHRKFRHPFKTHALHCAPPAT